MESLDWKNEHDEGPATLRVSKISRVDRSEHLDDFNMTAFF